MECRAFGVVRGSQQEVSQKLAELMCILRASCTTCGQFETLEMVYSVPVKSGTDVTTLRLSRRQAKHSAPPRSQSISPFAAPTVEGWLVQHEGAPMRGPAVAALPAAVREITESECHSPHAPDFFSNLGAKHEYTLEKSGNDYLCIHEGFEMRAAIVNASTIPAHLIKQQQAGVPVKGKSLGCYVMDVYTRVGEGQHVAACQAVGTFGELLAGLVTLQPALIPINAL